MCYTSNEILRKKKKSEKRYKWNTTSNHRKTMNHCWISGHDNSRFSQQRRTEQKERRREWVTECRDMFGCSCTIDSIYILYYIQLYCTIYTMYDVYDIFILCVHNLSTSESNLHHIRLGKSVLSTHTYSLSHWTINFIVWMISSDQIQRAARIAVSSFVLSVYVFANTALMISVNGLKFQLALLLFFFKVESEEIRQFYHAVCTLALGCVLHSDRWAHIIINIGHCHQISHA